MKDEDLGDHPAIDVFCGLIESLPDKFTQTAMIWVGMAIGVAPEPTGLPETRDRLVKQMHWDMEIRQLRERMAHLVDEVGVDEQFVVEGAFAFLQSYFVQFASPEVLEENQVSHARFLETLHEQLKLPIADRRDQGSDAELHDFIEKIEKTIANGEDTRQEHEEVLDLLRASKNQLLSEEFWRSFRSWWIRKRRLT